MGKLNIEFDWYRAFDYELTETKGAAVIRQKGAKVEKYAPLQIHPGLYLDFAKIDGSPEQCLQFARRWGFLRTPECHKGAEESLADWRTEIKSMRFWIAALGDGGPAMRAGRARSALTKLTVHLAIQPDGRRALALSPACLMDAMLLQFAASDASISTCQQCGNWFEVGAEGKRAVAKFCSDKCRFRYNNERRARQ